MVTYMLGESTDRAAGSLRKQHCTSLFPALDSKFMTRGRFEKQMHHPAIPEVPDPQE
ncbi:hypothetical protein SBA5_560018 [Candidatus Sulfotelmatomonas gaucii]|uniref:Uncharacterized protein n=1 Tax=Candidatus Sulfuritelmatomonas gaucii TaxID=2043161 RepID=A0A2N9LUD8_9BACT|nr:hypothetical protein SBA5_560018 [Candidatus Sulfotelmatomonas gaucii]